MPETKLFPDIINKLLEGIVLLDCDKKIIFWNKWIEQASNIPVENAVGKSLFALFPDLEYTRIDTCIEQAIKYRQSSFISHTMNPIMLPLFHFKDGVEKTKIFHNLRITSLESPDSGFLVMIFITDETINVLKEQLLKKRALEEKILNEKLRKEIDERRQIEEKLKLNTLVLNNTKEGVVITNHESIIESVNPAFIQITGYTEKEAVGQHIRLLKSGKHPEEFYKSLWATINAAGHWKGEFINKKPDDSLIVVESTIDVIRNREGEIINYVSIFHDITQRKKQEEILELRSRTDSLTGLSNRRYFDEALDIQWQVCIRNHFFIGIMMIDVDFFKKYNDAYGHQSGDDCLVKISRVLQANVRRSNDIIARYGGEEFVIVLIQTSPENIREIAESIMRDVQSLKIRHSASDISEYVTISMGIASLTPTKDLSYTMLIEAADNALYLAKKSGRNRIKNILPGDPPGL